MRASFRWQVAQTIKIGMTTVGVTAQFCTTVPLIDVFPAELAAALNVSVTSAATVANTGGQDNFPDLVVCHTCVVEMEEPTDADAHFAWEARLGQRVSHQCFPVVVELKRGPSRPLRSGKFVEERERLLAEAETDLSYYLAVHFERDPDAQSVIAISGTGAWWRWAKFDRKEAPPLHLFSDTSSPKLLHMQRTMKRKFQKAPPRYLGTRDSDNAFNNLRRNALIPILEAHPAHYKTRVAPKRQPPAEAST